MIDSALPAAVDAELVAFFHRRRPSLDRVAPEFTAAAGELEAFVLRGGKRLRPSFAWWGWRGAGGAGEGPEAAAALRACAALELIQAGALVHDDLMDASDTRRGHPTVHRAFAARHRAQHWNGDPERYGLAAAILLGDVALAWADDLFRAAVFGTAGLHPHSADRAVGVWEQMRTELMGGQLLDVLTEHPLRLGAALAGGSPQVQDAYTRYGADVGVAFQLRDDLLGVFGDPAVTGKPAGDDLREGKRTLLVALALETADESDPTAAAAVRDALGRDLAAAEVADLRAHLVRLGAVGAVEQRITELTRRGLTALNEVALDPDACAALRAMATAATARTS